MLGMLYTAMKTTQYSTQQENGGGVTLCLTEIIILRVVWPWPIFQQIKYVLNGFTNGAPWQSNKFKAQSFALPICNAAKTAKVFVFGMVNMYSSVLSGCCVCQYHQFSMHVSHH